jgi:hypothetical protein
MARQPASSTNFATHLSCPWVKGDEDGINGRICFDARETLVSRDGRRFVFTRLY